MASQTNPIPRPRLIITRHVSPAYERCLRSDTSAPISVARADAQHAAYCEALGAQGIPTVALDPDPECPDCCFIEDTAVVLGKSAVLTRPGAPARRGESMGVESALREVCELHVMDSPDTLDGGDVLRVGSHLFVGLSARTNAGGANFLARVAEAEGITTHRLNVPQGLHFKSAVTAVDARTLVYTASMIDHASIATLEHAGFTCLAAPEPVGANVLAIGSHIFVSAAAPQTNRMLKARGFATEALTVDEFHAGDGALTCLSLRIPAQGQWCT